MVPAREPSIWKLEEGGLEGLVGHPQLPSEFRASLGYMRLYLKTKTRKGGRCLPHGEEANSISFITSLVIIYQTIKHVLKVANRTRDLKVRAQNVHDLASDSTE